MKPLAPPDSHHLRAAEGWLELGNHAEADAELDHIIPALHSHPEVLELRWQVYAKAKRWEACVDIASALVKAASNRPSGWIHRSYALHELKRTREALEELLPAVELFPQNWLIRYNAACYTCQLGHKEEACVWLECACSKGDLEAIKRMALDDTDLKPIWGEIGGIGGEVKGN